MQIIMVNATIIITISNLCKMHLTLGDDRRQVRACTALIPPIPPTVGEGSIAQVTRGAL